MPGHDAQSEPYLTPPAIAKRYGVNPEKVRAWIERGELLALNLGDKVRPRYRIRPEDLSIFEAARLVVAREERRQARRRLRPRDVQQWV